MKRLRIPKEHLLRKQLAEYLANEGYTPFQICVRLGYSLRNFQVEAFQNPFLDSEEKRLIEDEAYREEVVTKLVEKMYASQSQISGDSLQSNGSETE